MSVLAAVGALSRPPRSSPDQGAVAVRLPDQEWCSG